MEYIKKQETRGRPANEKTEQFIETLDLLVASPARAMFILCDAPKARQSLRCSSTYKKWKEHNGDVIRLEVDKDHTGFWAVKR